MFLVMLIGILLVIFASLFFGISPAIVKLATIHGIDPASVGFYQMAITTLSFACIAGFRRERFVHPIKLIILLVGLGVVGMGMTNLALNYAFTMLPVGTATMIHFLYPTVVLLAMTAIRHERVTGGKACAVLCCLVGLYFFSNPKSGLNLKGIMLALSSTATYSIFIIASDLLSDSSVTRYVRLFYMSVGSLLTFGSRLISLHSIRFPTTGGDGMVLLALGVLLVAGYSCITSGIERIGGGTAAFLNMIEPITSMTVGVLLYHDVLHTQAMVGCALILMSMIIVVFIQKNKRSP